VTRLEELAEWAATLRLEDVPPRVAAEATSQVISQLAATRAGSGHPYGATVTGLFGAPFERDAHHSASALAGLTGWLHDDDTAYAGHLSHSTVSVPLAYAYHGHLDGAQLVAAVVAANETAARVTAAATLGPHRGQGSLHTQLAGAVAGRLHLQGAPPARWRDALSLALSAPPWALSHGIFAGDAQVLGQAAALRQGLDACDAAAAGLGGPADILEHPDGFLARFSTVPIPEALDAGLSERWHTDTLSFKMHPGGPGVDAAVDAALALHDRMALHDRTGPLRPSQVSEVVITTSLYTVVVDDHARRHARGPGSPLSSLVLSAGYPVATALLRGALTADDFCSPAWDDPARWALAEKVRLEHDEDMTRQSIVATAPVGEALRQAGGRGERWLEEVGGRWLVDLVGPPGAPSTTFEGSTKVTPARVEVVLVDGTRWTHEVHIPLGAAGPHTAANHPRLVRAKFLAGGGPEEVLDGLERLVTLPAADLRRLLRDALRPDVARPGPAVHDALVGS
jgi:2-methylcitrate dehydratase PrpD